MAHFLPSRQKAAELYECRGTQLLEGLEIVMLFRICLGSRCSVAVETVSKAEDCHGCRIVMASSARVRVQLAILICLGSRKKGKKCDKKLTHIVRVSICDVYKVFYVMCL